MMCGSINIFIMITAGKVEPFNYYWWFKIDNGGLNEGLNEGLNGVLNVENFAKI